VAKARLPKEDTLRTRSFGKLGQVSALSLGGGGIGQVFGKTTRQETVATVREAVESGITLLDVAPSYGNGEAERVIGEAFEGRLPNGVRISTKCQLGNPPADQVLPLLERSLAESLERTKLKRVDLFFLHSMLLPDELEGRLQGTPRSLFVEAVRPAMERLMQQGRIGAWAISGVGVPSALLQTIAEDPPPAAIQAIANLLDSPGGLKRYDEPARPREIIAASHRRGIAVMGIRAVQASALTDAMDRPHPPDHPDMADYRRAEPFRALAKEVGESPASLAHRYALSMPGIATVVLGVKNRRELRECIQAEAQGALDPSLIARIDAAVGRTRSG
jgi:aryl-alcohol dehydrogenase-like predicted oxidoreductase